MSPAKIQISDAERDVLKTLWELGPATVRQLRSKLLEQGREWAHTTINTLLSRMVEKGLVTSDTSGFAHVFSATVSREALDEFTHFALGSMSDRSGIRTNNEPDSIWNRIRQVEPAIDFIGRYIELAATATGGVGYCVFPEDRHRSFGVHEKGNYWHCFAGCGGGSIIDFWMRWKQLKFVEAVHELRVMLEV